MFYKFINETCVRQCPKNGVVKGRAISNLHRYFDINLEVAKDEGYKKLIIDEQPIFDTEKQCLTRQYEDTNDCIYCRWIVCDIEQDFLNNVDNI